MSPRSSSRTVVVLASLTLVAATATAQQPPQQRPKCDTAEHRQFDFWVGEWEVSGPDGSRAGSNTIRLILEDCVLHESWDGGSNKGQSFNAYSRNEGRWFQTWVDDSGTVLRLAGGLVDGRMVLSGDGQTRDGHPIRHEIAWTPLEDGRVKQHWRMSRDGGEEWQDAFVGFYAKKEPSPQPPPAGRGGAGGPGRR